MYFISRPFVLFHLVSYALQAHLEKIKSYDGAQVWQAPLRGSSDVQVIKKLIDKQEVLLWNFTPKQADFLVQAEDKLKINRRLNANNLNHTVLIMDVQRKVDAQKPDPVLWNEKTLRTGHRLNWKEYPTLSIIDEYFDFLTENFASVSKVSTIGYTAENRTIKMVKISNGNPKNKAILIMAGLHAREWIGITSALYILDRVVTKFDHLPLYMKNKDWIIIPLLNPDGFEYSHTHDRLWRKNRRQSKKCKGVDLNRNFELDWDITGLTVKEECFERNSGPHPFSEAESTAIRNLIMKTEKKPDAFIDLHSYGQLILYPWSANPTLIDDKNLQKTTAELMKSAIFNSTGKTYKSGVAYHTVYPAPGAAIDWVYSSGVPLSFVIAPGDQGFLLPPEQIEGTCKEVHAAAKALSKYIDPDFVNRVTYYGSWF